MKKHTTILLLVFTSLSLQFLLALPVLADNSEGLGLIDDIFSGDSKIMAFEQVKKWHADLIEGALLPLNQKEI